MQSGQTLFIHKQAKNVTKIHFQFNFSACLCNLLNTLNSGGDAL
jgi:hypothetical protein